MVQRQKSSESSENTKNSIDELLAREYSQREKKRKWRGRLWQIARILIDACICALALLAALFLRFEGSFDDRNAEKALRCTLDALPLVTALYMGVFAASGLYRILWRYAGLREILTLVIMGLIGGFVVMAANMLFSLGLSNVVIVMSAFLAVVLLGGVRLCFHTLALKRRKGKIGIDTKEPILIVGAGFTASNVIRSLLRKRDHTGRPVAAVDDDPRKLRTRILGVPVLGTLDDIPELVDRFHIREIIIAIPSLVKQDKYANLVSVCNETRCRVRVLSNHTGEDEYDSRKNPFRDISITDILPRGEVSLDMTGISEYLHHQVVMVSGGGGSIGSEICKQIVPFHPKLLIIFDIYENNAYELEADLKAMGADVCPRKIVIGSIRDKMRLDEVMETFHPDVVFHAAAHKHVPILEDSPGEAVKNNVLGTRNLLASAAEHGVKRFVQLSTDKAVNPTNVMGATKRVTEMLIQYYARTTEMKCMAVRFGNVLGSHGSVIPLFVKQIRAGGPVTITHPDITRYFMTIPEAAQLVLQAGCLAHSGAIYVLEMGEPQKIVNLAKKVIRFYGYVPDVDMPIVYCGLRPGEKLYEELLMECEKDQMRHTAHDKIMIAPPIQFDDARFMAQIKRFEEVVWMGDDAVIKMLHEMVPSFCEQQTPEDQPAATKTDTARPS